MNGKGVNFQTLGKLSYFFLCVKKVKFSLIWYLARGQNYLTHCFAEAVHSLAKLRTAP